MRIRLDYGQTGLVAELPDKNLIGVLGLKIAPPIVNPDKAVADALANPINTEPLSKLAKGKSKACIVICDITRPVPNKTLLPPVLRILENAGMAPEQITILIATGTHRPNLGDELTHLVGGETTPRGGRLLPYRADCAYKNSRSGRSRGRPRRGAAGALLWLPPAEERT